MKAERVFIKAITMEPFLVSDIKDPPVFEYLTPNVEVFVVMDEGTIRRDFFQLTQKDKSDIEKFFEKMNARFYKRMQKVEWSRI